MLLIEDDVIYLTRGDDAEFEITIQDEDGNAYQMREGDKLILTVRTQPLPNAKSEMILQVESETNQFTIAHADTAEAQVGKHSADIELRSGGLIRTIWPQLEGRLRYNAINFANFVIMPEVTQ